ncbi:hypothetical protein EVAR_15917_1 [Eumeta japonica]|uniref:Uncharacterized protein n=1 Tax=Eumeta variegata TaxID=151549 RepID=A0A4C1UMN9_EUMVA|nr:hypothetical protein EVAR_15917_1 [Eumeta japonica]
MELCARLVFCSVLLVTLVFITPLPVTLRPVPPPPAHFPLHQLSYSYPRGWQRTGDPLGLPVSTGDGEHFLFGGSHARLLLDLR